MSETIEDHLKRVIKHLSKQISDGNNSNRHNLDGYTLSGLKHKLTILQECLSRLNSGK